MEKNRLKNLLKEVCTKLITCAIVKYLLEMLDYLIHIINAFLF